MLDASILLLPSVGFLPPEDPRVRGTLAAIERHLMRDGFVLRHDPREVEQQPAEGAFLACTLWLADAYVLAGEFDKAQELFTRVVAIANDLGLLAEEYDTAAGRQTGNFPQALTHIALINTAHNLCAAKTADREAGDAALEIAAVVLPWAYERSDVPTISRSLGWWAAALCPRYDLRNRQVARAGIRLRRGRPGLG